MKTMSSEAMKVYDALTQEQREEILSALLCREVGPLRFKEVGAEKVGYMPFGDAVAPGESKMVVFYCCTPFRPRRIVIHEPCIEVVNAIASHSAASFTRGHRHDLLQVPRGVWDVETVFIGSDAVFLTRGTMSGDAFAPTSDMDFDGRVCDRGSSICMRVRHKMSVALPFNATMLGDILEASVGAAPACSDA